MKFQPYVFSLVLVVIISVVKLLRQTRIQIRIRYHNKKNKKSPPCVFTSDFNTCKLVTLV